MSVVSKSVCIFKKTYRNEELVSFHPLWGFFPFFLFSKEGTGGGCWTKQQHVGRDEPDTGSPLPSPSQLGPSREGAASFPPCPAINRPARQQLKRNPVLSSLLCPHRCLVASDACACPLLCHCLCCSQEAGTAASFSWQHRKVRVHAVHHTPLPFPQHSRV